ncbi:MAG: hypothetical protein JWN75_1259 [Candidatus Saccharibacteria bacterium]|nr:hypothetical protein [Candidatus Saccharibacteria bacterium]
MSTADGKRVVGLYIPFSVEGVEVRDVSLGPFLFDHDLKWQEGKYQTSLALIVDLSGLSEKVLRQLRYPDVSRVMTEFMSLIPEHISNDIRAGAVPRPIEPEPGPDDEAGDEVDTEEQRPEDEQLILGGAPKETVRARPGAAGVKSRAFDPDRPYSNLDPGSETGPAEPPADEGGGFEGLTG